MKDLKNKKNHTNFGSQLPKGYLESKTNPIDEVMKKILEKDSKSCKLASARLSQIKAREEIENNKKKNEKNQ
jgi:hypothetical protein